MPLNTVKSGGINILTLWLVIFDHGSNSDEDVLEGFLNRDPAVRCLAEIAYEQTEVEDIRALYEREQYEDVARLFLEECDEFGIHRVRFEAIQIFQ